MNQELWMEGHAYETLDVQDLQIQKIVPLAEEGRSPIGKSSLEATTRKKFRKQQELMILMYICNCFACNYILQNHEQDQDSCSL